MNILILPSWYPTKQDPIHGIFFREQARALTEYGHSVVVFAFYPDSEGKTCTEKIVTGNMTEFLIHVKPVHFHLTYFVLLWEMLRLLRTELHGWKPDVIHVHSFRGIRYARALRVFCGVPIVVTEHVTWFEQKMFTQKELSQIRCDYNAVDALLAVSPGLRDQILPYCTNKDVLIVPNMVEQRFLDGPLHCSAGDTFGFVYLGALGEKKGVDILLSAFDAVRRKLPNVRLTICGEGKYGQQYIDQAEALGLNDVVCFRGQVSRSECAEELRKNQVFVLPSRAETFGVVYIEAMACGLPIIMTKIGAWTILAREETGLAIDVGSVDQLVDAMLYMAENPDRYDAEKIRSFCAENFSAESVCRRLTEIYTETIQKKKR